MSTTYHYTRCRQTHRLRQKRIEEATEKWLIEKFSGTDQSDSTTATRRQASNETVERDGHEVVVELSNATHVLPLTQAHDLHAALDEALYHTETFSHTVCERRPDGSYVVTRRRADSSGHQKVFDSFRALDGLYERLPSEFTAEDIKHPGLTGSRRHMLVRHFTEHPAFDCALVCRQPLTARKDD